MAKATTPASTRWRCRWRRTRHEAGKADSLKSSVILSTLFRAHATGTASQLDRPVPVARPKGELADLLTIAYPSTRMADISLEAGVRQRLDRVLAEQRQQDRLREKGFQPYATSCWSVHPERARQ
jgi:hypothetical protein